ncbi:MAG: electron transport complex subunit RsxE [Nitrospirota bacterium]
MLKDFIKGLWAENPIFRLLLGMCPTLAVTTSAINGIGMGVATTFVIICSNVLVSLLRTIIPGEVRIPSFIVIIASFVTIADLVMAAFVPALHEALGIFIPLIVVNCIVLGRAEAFASKNSISKSLADGVGMGLGFTIGLFVLGGIREILGNGSILGYNILGSGYVSVIAMILPAGGFFTLGILLAIMNKIDENKEKKSAEGHCGHCG